jgi:hypothetical protein
VMTCARGLATLPATQIPGTLVAPKESWAGHPSLSRAQPRSARRELLGHEPWRHE